MSNNGAAGIPRMVGYFKALSNPHRLRIFLRLFAQCPPGGTCCADPTLLSCVGDLGRRLAIAPSTVSHHLKELRQAGLIRMDRRGRRVACSLDPRVVEDLASLFAPAAKSNKRNTA